MPTAGSAEACGAAGVSIDYGNGAWVIVWCAARRVDQDSNRAAKREYLPESAAIQISDPDAYTGRSDKKRQVGDHDPGVIGVPKLVFVVAEIEPAAGDLAIGTVYSVNKSVTAASSECGMNYLMVFEAVRISREFHREQITQPELIHVDSPESVSRNIRGTLAIEVQVQYLCAYNRAVDQHHLAAGRAKPVQARPAEWSADVSANTTADVCYGLVVSG